MSKRNEIVCRIIQTWGYRIIMWAIIFFLLFAASITGFIYLINRFSKFCFVRRFSRGNKKIKIVISTAVLIIITASVWLTIGYMNAIISLLHLVIFWLICDLANWIIQKKLKKSFKRYYAGGFAILITLGYLSVGWFLVHHVWETDYTIETDKNVGDLRIIQFADSHVGTTFDGEGFSEYVNQMQELNPDVVLITGDFIDDDTTKEDMILSCKALGTLETTYGVYFSFGNHDKGYYGADYRGYSGDDLIAELEKNKVTVLEDENVLIDDRFYIVGRQDYSEVERGGSRAEMGELVENLDKDKFIIVMDHQPHDYEKQAESKVDLVLSGHTHGGQLIPINFVGEWFIKANDRTYGYEKRDDTNFIVTSGISDWAIKFKTGCKSEFVVIDVKGK